MVDRDRPRRARGELRRQLLLDAAIDVIYEKGISGATHRAIAARAGVPASSTTYFFASIEDLISEALSAVMDQEIARIVAFQERVDAEQLSADEIIDAFVELVISESKATATAQFEVYLFAARNPALQKRAVETITATRQTAEIALRSQGVQDAAAASATVTALIDGFTLHRLAHPEPGSADALRRALRATFAGFMALQDSEGIRGE
jgi:TetR/AcrR family transcriptional regulator, regulator of biofilm formation and stress response